MNQQNFDRTIQVSPAGHAMGHSAARDHASRDDVAHWRAVVASLPEIRQSKVDRVRDAIQTGTYDEDALLDRALPRIESDLDALLQQAE